MAYDIAGMMDGIRNTYKQSRVGTLAKLAYSQPERRQGALAEMYGIDPNSANTMRKEFDEQDKADLANFSRTFIAIAPKDESAAGAMYQNGVQRFGAKFRAMGIEPPKDWKQALPFFEQAAGITPQQAPAKVQEAQWFAKSMGLDPDKNPEEYSAFIRQYSGAGGKNNVNMGISSTGIPYRTDETNNAFDYYDWNSGTWKNLGGPGGQQTPPRNPPPNVVQPPQMQTPLPVAGNPPADPKVAFQGLASKHGAQLTSVTRTPERNAQVGGVPNSYHLSGQAGDFVVPQQNKAQFMAEARAMGYQAIDEGDHIHIEPMGRGVATNGAPQAPNQPASNPFAKPTKTARRLTPQEVAAEGLPVGTVAQIDESTGAISIINKPSEKEPSADASKSAGFYSRMEQSERILSQIEAEGYDPSKNTADYFTAGRVSTNWLASPKGRQYYNAASNWIRANLRRESGAAIGVDEMKQEFATYFPMPGDGPAEIKQKRQLRAQTAQAVRMAGAPAERAAERNAPAGGNNYDPLGILK